MKVGKQVKEQIGTSFKIPISNILLLKTHACGQNKIIQMSVI